MNPEPTPAPNPTDILKAIPNYRIVSDKYSLFKFFLSRQKEMNPRSFALAALDMLDAISYLEGVEAGEINRGNVDIIFPPPPPEVQATREFLQNEGTPLRVAPVAEPVSDPYTQLNQSATTNAILQALKDAGVHLPAPTKPMPNMPMRDTRVKGVSSGQIIDGRWHPNPTPI
jgi:hypothetical protein